MMKVFVPLMLSIIAVFTCLLLPQTAFAKSSSSTTVSQEQSSKKSKKKSTTEPKSIAFKKDRIELPVGGSEMLEIRVSPKKAELKGHYYSSKPDVVFVTKAGKLKARSRGRATVTFKSNNGLKIKCRVTVKKLSKSIKLNRSEVTLLYDKSVDEGFTKKLKYILDAGAYDKVSFKSENEKIATVSAKGVITPHKAGKVKIVAKALGGAKSKCTVTVLDNTDTDVSLNQRANIAAMRSDAVERRIYGKSCLGRPLEAYIIRGEESRDNKVLFADFAVHGFEDSYARDGQVLVGIGNELVEYYSQHTEKLGKYTLVIVPCANPDGTIEGINNLRACDTAFGRCTAAHVDINRDFGAFRGKESRALRDLLKKYPPKIYLNFHGWLNTSIGTTWLARLSTKKLGFDRLQEGSYGKGYVINYVRNKYRAATCLVEYKSPASAEKSVNKTKRFINEIMEKH